LALAKLPPPRITILTAELQPVIVCLCRVRNKIWRVVQLDPLSGKVTPGKWIEGHAFPHYSVLSPNGEWLSFASLSEFIVGKPPEMEPHYTYEGAPGWGPLSFISESTLGSRYVEFQASSDGSPSPFEIQDTSLSFKPLLSSLRKQLFPKSVVQVKLNKREHTDASNGRAYRFSTEPDLGVLDDEVGSAVLLVTGELVIARNGIVTCFEPASKPPLTTRWEADLRFLSSLEDCQF